jgi:NTE family protein
MKSDFEWALVLAGGGARGLAHIGFLKGLEKNSFPKPSLVVGTSMGAIVGGLYACGMSAAEMERFVTDEFEITDYLSSFVFKINGPVGKAMQTGQALAILAGRPGIDPGNRVLELLKKLTEGKNFDETGIRFRCNAVDLATGRHVVFSSGSVADAMRASMSLPVFFEPVMKNGMCLVDGGLFDNMPVSIAREEGSGPVLAVNVNHFDESSSEDLKNGPQIIFRSIDCAIHAQDTGKKAKADLTMEIIAHEALYSFYKHKELIQLGEQTVKKNLAALKAFFSSGSSQNNGKLQSENING